MHLFVISFFAGVLTVAAPCILPLLPVVVGGSVSSDNQKRWWRPLIITGGLVVSVILFTLLLKATTALLGVPQSVWNVVSGVIVLLLGLNLLSPTIWTWFAQWSGFHNRAGSIMQASGKARSETAKDVLMGASLGPVFSSCSPTYAFIVAVVLPRSFAEGFLYLVSYALGLATVLLLISVAGQSVVRKLGWLSNPNGCFRKVLGVLFILVGLAVITGLDRDFQAYVLEQGWYDPIMKLEQRLQ